MSPFFKAWFAALPTLCFLFIAFAAGAVQIRSQAGDPEVRVILKNDRDSRAWIYYQGQRMHVIPKFRLDAEWAVEDIRRESILFSRTSTHSFVELRLSLEEKPKFHKGWSFLGQPIGLWEAVEMLSQGFGFNAVMNFQAGGSVIPCCHADSLERLLLKTIPAHHRFAFAGPVLIVLPVHPAGENWTTVLNRMKLLDPESLAIRYPGMKKPGSLLSRGDDIQFVLREIALGGEVPLQFPKDLHFPVYASFKEISFFQILAKVVYVNQCFIIEREDGLEIQPYPRQVQPILSPPAPEMITAGPKEPQMGWGPQPPAPFDPESAGWKKITGGLPSVPPVTSHQSGSGKDSE